MKVNINKEGYKAPDIEVIKMMTEGCVLSGSTLKDWVEGENIGGEV